MPELSTSQEGDEFEDQEAEANRALFIRGISEKVTEDELYELFLQVGRNNGAT